MVRVQRAAEITNLADSLTFVRVLLALPLGWLVATDSLPLATVLLVTAWWTDFADGRVARRIPGRTRLGEIDPIADILVGIALISGLIISGKADLLPFGALTAALLTAFVVHRNLAWCMLLQALAYELFLTTLWAADPSWLLLPVTTAVVMLVVNWRRFVDELLPAFFSGIGANGIAAAIQGHRR